MGKRKLTPARAAATKKYLTEKVDALTVYVPKGQKEIIKAAAKAHNLSVSQYISLSVWDYFARDPINNHPDVRTAYEKMLAEDKINPEEMTNLDGGI